MIESNSKFHIHFEVLFNQSRNFRPKFVVDIANHSMIQVEGDRADLSPIYFGQMEDGRSFIEVEAKPFGERMFDPTMREHEAIRYHDFWIVERCSCQVYLDLYGNNTQRIPSSSLVSLTISEPGQEVTLETVSSKNYD